MKLSVVVVLALLLLWIVVIGQVTVGQILLGLLFGILFVLVSGAGQDTRIPLRDLPRRAANLLYYLLILVPYGIVRSNLEMAGQILQTGSTLQPGIVRVEVEPISENAAALIGHAITLGPGEMVVDYSEDRRWIYVHVIDVTGLETKRVPLWRRYIRVLNGVCR